MGNDREGTVISVIIPSHNRAELLAGALDSLVGQSLPQASFEVLAIDNCSDDHTADVVARFSARIQNLHYLYEAEPGLHAGRHKGMLAARGDFLVFADDDIEALPTWLSSIRDAFSDSTVAMVGGNNLPYFTAPPPGWLSRLWERPAPGGGRLIAPLSILELPDGIRPISPSIIWGCNFSIRKEVLLAAGGFHPDAMPRELIRFRGDGETHVSRYVAAKGMKCLFHSGASVRHKVTPERMNFAYFHLRGFNQGISDSYTTLRQDSIMSSPPRRNMLLRATGRVWRTLKALSDTDRDARRALSELQAGHREGFAYHQQAYREDAALRDWVHKPRYFDEAATHA